MTAVIRRGRPSAPARSLRAPRRCRRGIPCRFRARSARSAMESAICAFCSTSRIVVPALCSDWMISNTCSTRMGARPMEGSSSIMSFGCAHQRAAHGEHLLFAAGERSGDLTGGVPSAAGNSSIHLFEPRHRSVALASGVGAHFKVFLARSSARTHAVPPGRCARPVLDDLVAGPCAQCSRPENRCRRRGCGEVPQWCRSVVVLPAPFAPIERYDLALVDLEGDALDGVDRAVIHLNVS